MTSWKTIRVFISSTFRDMQAERDWLVRFVFPKLREELLPRRIHLVDVDLRWGVTSEQDALGVCREVIDECRPRFMGILGGRYGWVPEGREHSITADEVNYGVLGREAEHRGHAFFYFRDELATAQMVEETPGAFREPDDSADAPKLAALKRSIADAGLPVFIYPAQWDVAQQRLTGLGAFGQRVHADLLQSLKDDPELAARFTSEGAAQPDEFAEEAEQMEAFIEERTERYVIGSREPLLQEMTAFAAADPALAGPSIFVLSGDPGSGKSALLAHFCRHSTINSQLSTFLLPHFIGASAGSTDLRRTLRRLCHELARAAGNSEPLPLDIKELITHFQNLLAEAAGRQRVILVFDALNQFDATDGAHWLNWLPQKEKLPLDVRIVASVIAPADGQPEHQTLAILRARPGARIEKLEPLTEADTLAVVEGSLRHYAKRLSAEQLAALLAKPAGRLPLYVLTALEELRTLGTYEEITARIRELPGEARALFGWILTERLAHDPGFRDREGRPCGVVLVEKFAACLGVSRHGLSPAELAALLDPGDPLGNVAALLRLLRPYLMRRGELLDFYHGQFREAAEAVFFKTDSERCTSHQFLADFFVGCAKGTDPQRKWETDRTRGFAECVFHLIKAGQYQEAAGLLTNIPFLLHKVRVGLLEWVFDDYRIFFSGSPAALSSWTEIWATFFRENAHILRRDNEEWPTHKILLQLAVEHADDSPLTIGAEQWLAEGCCDWFWLRRVLRLPHAQKNPCLAVLEGHTSGVSGAMALADGRLLSWSYDNTLRLWDGHSGACLEVLKGHTKEVRGALALDGGRLLSWSFDKTLRLWDGYSGVCLAVLEGHTKEVTGALVLPDGRLLSWSEDKTLRLWDGVSGTCLAVLEGHTETIKGALALADGRLLSWAGDKTLRLWDGVSGACLAVLEGHTSGVSGAMALADGRLLSRSWDDTLRLWDGSSGACLAVLKGHTNIVYNALALADGRLLSWSGDKTLRLWDGHSGACLAVLEGHTKEVTGALVLPDGRLLSWSWDKTLRLWDGVSGTCLAVLEGHTETIKGALVLADGRLLSWAGDKTLRLWDGVSGACLAVLDGHARWVYGALALADGRLLSWAGDKTLRLWDGVSGGCLEVLKGHTEQVVGDLALADGRLLSWSGDKTLRLWDSASGSCLAVLEGHTNYVIRALALADGRLLSYSGDHTLRLWDGDTGACLAVLEGHTELVDGVLPLADGRLLTWSWDKTLRLWDGHSSTCLAVLEGHTNIVYDALALADGRLLSRSGDKTLRLWESHSGACLAVLEGHTKTITGALALADGRLLSWSDDNTLRLWDGVSGMCLAVLEGHTQWIKGVLALADGRLLSWSLDHTLRLWDGSSGACLEVLAGHNGPVDGVLALADGRLLSWSWDKTLRLWDGHSGACLEMVTEDQFSSRHPEWLETLRKAQGRRWIGGDFFVLTSNRSAHLHHKTIPTTIADWNAESDTWSGCLLPDGTAVVTQLNGQVCFLKLYHGKRRVSFAEAESMLPLLAKKQAVIQA